MNEMSDISMKEEISSKIDDLDLIARELGEAVTIGKSSGDLDSLVLLLTTTEAHLSEALSKLGEHAERQEIVEALEAELATRNQHIAKLQQVLKDSESVLMTAIFQSNQKLKSIAAAESRKVEPETLIRFAHRISKDNAVAAPLTWQLGDPDRPFPTDLDLRKGFLARRSDAPDELPAPPGGLLGPMHPPPLPTRPQLFPAFPRQGSPGPAALFPRIPPASPYQGGPMPRPLHPQSPRTLPPPYPSSPRAWPPQPFQPFPRPPPVASPRLMGGAYQAGPIPQANRLKRPAPPTSAPKTTAEGKTDAVSSPDSSSSSSSDNNSPN